SLLAGLSGVRGRHRLSHSDNARSALCCCALRGETVRLTHPDQPIRGETVRVAMRGRDALPPDSRANQTPMLHPIVLTLHTVSTRV
ncbi:unnamed protein product, partial [Protopolystoma xenopodis]